MKLHQSAILSQPPIVELPCGAGTEYVPGQCLTVTDGVATLATGTTVPNHICYGKKTGAESEAVHAIRITDDMTFAAPLAADGAALVVGDKVNLHTDGIKVTGTTGAVATIVGFCTTEKAAGDEVLVKF